MKRIKTPPLATAFTRLNNLSPSLRSSSSHLSGSSLSNKMNSWCFKTNPSTTAYICSFFPPLLKYAPSFPHDTYYSVKISYILLRSAQSSLKAALSPNAIYSLPWVPPHCASFPIRNRVRFSFYHMNVLAAHHDHPDLPIKLRDPSGRDQCLP